MNKKLLMVAVGAALVAGPMLAAQAETKLYGHFHMSLDRFDNDTNEDGRVSSNSTRIGVRGTEDLGGGLKSIYQLETGVAAIDEGTGGLGGTLRNSYVGFAGDWGAVKVGRHDTPTKDLNRKLDRFNEEIGDARNFIGAGVSDARVSNMIRYESPSFGGATVTVQHTSNDASGTTSTVTAAPGSVTTTTTGEATASVQKSTSANLLWTSGPLFAGLAYEEQGSTTSDNPTDLRLAGRYDFGDFDVGLFWETMSDLVGVSGVDQDVLGVLASFKFANNRVKFQWYDADDIDGTAAEDGAKLWAISLDHLFSKTTRAYVSYAKVENDNGTTAYNIASANGGHYEALPATTLGASVTGFSAGMVIDF